MQTWKIFQEELLKAIMNISKQRLGRLCTKIKFLKIKVLLHFMIKISKLASRDSVPKDSASIAYRVFEKL